SIMSELVCIKSQEVYEDDFEKELDWLISEESRKEMEEEEEERWPPPMEPLECDSDRDSPGIVPPPPDMNDRTDEEKKYVLEKIQRANRELQDQEAPDLTRRRRLHFKDRLVDLVVPPPQAEMDGSSSEVGRRGGERETSEAENDVSGRFSELKLSPVEDGGGCGGDAGSLVKDSKVLVEKDGKFDVVSLNKADSQGLFPPIPIRTSNSSSLSSPRLQQTNISSSSLTHLGASQLTQSADGFRVPRPPAQARNRPSSAMHNPRGGQRHSVRRRVQSATGTNCPATFTLSAQQKELLQKSQERRAKLAREAEQRKREEEEHKRQENELAFKAWLMKKKEQLQEEKRILRAQEMERVSSQKEPCDPQESFRLWLQRKQQQQQRERQLTEVKKLEQDCGHLLRSREDCERAFKLWLRRKRVEKRAEQQAAREHSRRLVLEERRARRTRDLLCVEDKPFRFTEHAGYRF
uniref:Coiled-coil domain-containing protein 181 n=1 Tax=Takifugu rubripes TaxID=31033 RepID=H2V7U3_TAKRU